MTESNWMTEMWTFQRWQKKQEVPILYRWKLEGAESVSMTKKDWFSGKCIGRKRAPKVTDGSFEKGRKMIRLWIEVIEIEWTI
jgi:hypothetical protein